jgi:hypothetical protein
MLIAYQRLTVNISIFPNAISDVSERAELAVLFTTHFVICCATIVSRDPLNATESKGGIENSD